MTKTKNEALFDELRKAERKLRRPLMPMPPQPEHHRHPGPIPPNRPPHFPRERVLAIVEEAGEKGIRQKDIAERMMINPSSLSELINKLESSEYLKRVADPDDKRATRILLTEKGQARAYELKDERDAMLGKTFEPLTDEEKDQLIALLQKLNTETEEENY